MQYPLEAYRQIPPNIVSTFDYEPYAQRQMGGASWVYFSSGGADEITLRNNRIALERIQIQPRVLTDLSNLSTQVEIAGITYPHPIFLAPIAYQKLAHRDGEMASVMAASALEAPMVVSTQASVRMEDLAQQAESPLWFQLYVQPERASTLDLIKRAEASGYRAIVVTVDAPINGLRNAMQRIGFQVPNDLLHVNLPASTHPSSFEELIHHAPTWKDIEWLLTQTQLPVWLKGVLHPEDAKIAKELGCAGVIVSNHGGRVLDTVPSTIEVLPSIRNAVGPEYPLILDGGIRRGTDILKAISSGANAVMVGRPYVYGLSVAGALGVAHVIKLLKTELEVAMALSGCCALKQNRPDLR